MPHSHAIHSAKDRNSSRVDSKSKLLLLFTTIIAQTLIITYEQLIFFIAVLGLCVLMFRPSIGAVIKKLLVPLPLILSLTLLLVFSSESFTKLSFLQVTVEYSELEYSFFLVARSLLVVLTLLVVVESEDSFFEVIYALDSLKMPKVLVNVLLLMYRSALDLQEEARRLLDARYARSVGSKSSTGSTLLSLHTYRILGFLVGNLLLRSLQSSEARSDVLLSRGYQGTLHYPAKVFSAQGLFVLWLFVLLDLIILFSVNTRFITVGTIT